jgi:ABC-type sugar transport system permease subunit
MVLSPWLVSPVYAHGEPDYTTLYILIVVPLAAIVGSIMGSILYRKKYLIRTRVVIFCSPWMLLFLVIVLTFDLSGAVNSLIFIAKPGLPSQAAAYWFTYSVRNF